MYNIQYTYYIENRVIVYCIRSKYNAFGFIEENHFTIPKYTLYSFVNKYCT